MLNLNVVVLNVTAEKLGSISWSWLLIRMTLSAWGNRHESYSSCTLVYVESKYCFEGLCSVGKCIPIES